MSTHKVRHPCHIELTLWNDAALVRTLRLNSSEQDKSQLLSTIDTENVKRVTTYPLRNEWVHGREMSIENQNLWKEYVVEAPKKEPRRIFGSLKELDESKLIRVIRQGENARINIDGKLSLFVIRNAVQHPGVLEYLGRVAKENSLQRLTCRVSCPQLAARMRC